MFCTVFTWEICTAGQRDIRYQCWILHADYKKIGNRNKENRIYPYILHPIKLLYTLFYTFLCVRCLCSALVNVGNVIVLPCKRLTAVRHCYRRPRDRICSVEILYRLLQRLS